MKTFNLCVSGDLFDSEGAPVGDLALDTLASSNYVRWAPISDQQPKKGDSTYKERLYSLEVTPEHVALANGIVICRPWLKASALALGADKLVAIGRAGIGYDKIDLRACTAADVVVFNSPYGLTHSTAAAAMLLILAFSKRLPQQENIVREGRWDRQSVATGDDLEGQTLGIVGFGRTAAELVRLLAPFHMRVVAFSPHADPVEAEKCGVILLDDIETLFRQSDYISLHNRLSEQTRESIGAHLLRLMKPSAFFINVARGELVDERALLGCLVENRIAGAGLDVFADEPLPLTSPFLKLKNVILTPHWLCTTRQAARATMTGVFEGMLSVSRGKIPSNVLNTEVLGRSGFKSKLAEFEENS